MPMRRLLRCVALSCALLAAEPVLDQSHEGVTASASTYRGLDRAQTFTVELGGRLVRAEVMLSRQPSPTVDVVDLELRATEPDGRPSDDPPLALTSSLSTDELTAVPAWVAFAFAGDGVPVTAGERLALVVRAPFLEFPDGWAGAIGSDGCALGEGFFQDGGAPFEPQPGGFDGNFRTFVEVPEPGAAPLGAVASLAGLAAHARARGGA